jgi:tetratricopeptide (TPR) repeat protein
MKNKIALFFALVFFVGALHVVYANALDDGMADYYQKSWAQAQAEFQKVLQNDPNNSLALVYYIVCAYRDGDFTRIMGNLEDHLVDYPDDQHAAIELAFFHYTQAYIEGSDPAQALREFRQAALKGPNPLVHTGIGIVYYDIGDLTRAQKELARAMDMNPKDVLAYEYAGKILLSFAKDPKDALPYFQEVVALAPNYPDGHYYLARTLSQLGEAADAVAEYQKTIALDPLGVGRGGDARMELGDLYQKLGEFNKAREMYREALQLDPNNSLAKARLEKVAKEAQGK